MTVRSDPGPGPSEYALAYAIRGFVVALRCGAVVAAVVAAAVDGGGGVSRLWQLALLGGLVLWSAFFTMTAVRYGPGSFLVAGDSAVVALVLLAQPRLVPVASVVDETTWAIVLAGSAVYVALLSTGRLTGSLLAAGVIAAYMIGVPAETSQVRSLVVQATAVSVIMWLLRRGGRRADVIVADRDRERRRSMVEAARRADERIHRFQVHDTVLSMLSMVASGAVPADSPGLRRDARRAMQVMERFSGGWLDGDGTPVDLAEQLRGLTEELSVPVTVDLTIVHDGDAARMEVPAPVAAAITGAAGEALRNVDRHAGVSRACVRAERHGGAVTVTVADRGRGFEPVGAQVSRRGIRHSIVERMITVGGRATVDSRPGAGTEITLRWPRG
ncbi:sensor histidine kinase [Spirillospora sp. NPDC048911]|uniref:sensor histidine kinase n=1 Tax=Spirillospora sp. NPDC048911 TaxID=3364527 RepID=UPI00371EDFA0